jgi:glutathione synthase/RimK-type ligase-like ATP-grasp enzyme
MDSLEGYVSDDELAIEPLQNLGWNVETISWRDKTINWNDFEAVIIRTPWDYQREPVAFLKVLSEIDRSKARLENSLKIVEWNLSKLYLRELESAGIKIVPTVWGEGEIDETLFQSWLEYFVADEIVIKPIVSATAEFTYRLQNLTSELTEIFSKRKYMIQPFMPNITSEGEFSLFYFGGEYSHTILKTPKPKDFRVQEEHGGIIQPVAPTEKLLDTARKVFELIEPLPLYARIDFVRDAYGEFALMELELIEPALYFRMDEDAPKRFARVFNDWMKR